jgi:hypothetical protein
MSNPIYKVGETVYLRSSALLGFVEAVQIASVQSHNGNWIYSITSGNTQPTPGSLYGDRRSIIDTSIVYFSESEFVTLCESLQSVKVSLEERLSKINTAIESNCT